MLPETAPNKFQPITLHHPRPTYNGLLNDVLLCLGIEHVPKAASFGDRLKMLKTQLIGQKVRMIVFDEVQQISEHRGTEGAYKSADVFKVLMKAARVQLICAGLPHAIEIVDANQQLEELTFRNHPVHPFELDLAVDSDLMRFMRTINRELPFDEASAVAEPDVALGVALYGDCRPGRIMLLIHATVDYAIDNKRPRIDGGVLAETLRHRYDVPDEQNVFKMNRDDLNGYKELIRQKRQQRIRAAEERQSVSARHRRKRKAFGARGQ